jgi:NAD(P)-dependent dehydrogenase (short-subunit alcohol dehydrogenase family)
LLAHLRRADGLRIGQSAGARRVDGHGADLSQRDEIMTIAHSIARRYAPDIVVHAAGITANTPTMFTARRMDVTMTLVWRHHSSVAGIRASR